MSIALPAGRVHAFRAFGEKPLVTLGIHIFGKPTVNYVEPPPAGS